MSWFSQHKEQLNIFFDVEISFHTRPLHQDRKTEKHETPHVSTANLYGTKRTTTDKGNPFISLL